MKTEFHAANTRGYANHGWLEAKHSFSFANWYNPERVHFGALRVLNDDHIAAGMGFGTHPHDNMEIITIPLEGALAHQDSMGNGTTIHAGDIQVMSAGTGILHSEFNANKDLACKILQIWVFPNKRDVEPRYEQITLDPEKMKNHLHQIVSPNSDDEGVWIHQNAWFHLGKFEAGQVHDYRLHDTSNGVYHFVLNGKMKIQDFVLEQRDALGVWEVEQMHYEFLEPTFLLTMEIPMQF